MQLFQTSILILLLRKFCIKDIKEGETIVFDCVNLQSGDSCHQTCVHWWRAQCELACWCPWRMSLWQTRPAMEIRSIKLISIFTFYHLQIDTDPRGLINMFKVFLIKHLESHFLSSAKRIGADKNSRSGINLKKQSNKKKNQHKSRISRKVWKLVTNHFYWFVTSFQSALTKS